MKVLDPSKVTIVVPILLTFWLYRHAFGETQQKNLRVGERHGQCKDKGAAAKTNHANRTAVAMGTIVSEDQLGEYRE
jgi:hypothetical protein